MKLNILIDYVDITFIKYLLNLLSCNFRSSVVIHIFCNRTCRWELWELITVDSMGISRYDIHRGLLKSLTI